jgi:hypothetical protein
MKDKTVKSLLFIGLFSLFGLYLLIFLKLSEMGSEAQIGISENQAPVMIFKKHPQSQHKKTGKPQKKSSKVLTDVQEIEAVDQALNVTNQGISQNETQQSEYEYHGYDGKQIMSKHTNFKSIQDVNRNNLNLKQNGVVEMPRYSKKKAHKKSNLPKKEEKLSADAKEKERHKHEIKEIQQSNLALAIQLKKTNALGFWEISLDKIKNDKEFSPTQIQKLAKIMAYSKLKSFLEADTLLRLTMDERLPHPLNDKQIEVLEELLELKKNYARSKLDFLKNFVSFKVISEDNQFKKFVDWKSISNLAKKILNQDDSTDINWALLDNNVKERFTNENVQNKDNSGLIQIQEKYQVYNMNHTDKTNVMSNCNKVCLQICLAKYQDSNFHHCANKACNCNENEISETQRIRNNLNGVSNNDETNHTETNARNGQILLVFMVVFLILVFIGKNCNLKIGGNDQNIDLENKEEIPDYFVNKYKERMMQTI